MNALIERLRKHLTTRYTAKQNNTFANGVMIAGVVLNTIEIINNPTGFNWPMTITSIALVVIGGVYQMLFVRCPHCGDKLKGQKNKLPDRCPECNGYLDQLPKA